MEFGLLWFDNDPQRGLEEKVLRAAARYEKKYGRAPNTCFVNPGMLEGNGSQGPVRANGLEIRAGASVLLHHFWVGVTED